MNKIILQSLFLLSVVFIISSCHKRLDKFPANSINSKETFSSEEGYFRVLARVYGAMVLTSQNSPGTEGFGNGDVRGVDEGFSDFFRNYWHFQEMSTDMAKWKYADDGFYDIQFNKVDAANPQVEAMYGRCMIVITFVNEFLRESAPNKIAERGINEENIKVMRAEARFVRAYMYWVMMDLFGNPGFITENDPFGSFTPPQISRADLFNWVDNELKVIEGDLLPAGSATSPQYYGRADKAACWALRARMNLNAAVYLEKATPAITNFSPYYTEAIANAKKVISSGYNLLDNYQWLFLADNHLNNTEAIWTLNYDGLNSQSYGGATFIINGASSGSKPETINLCGLGGWGAMRATEKIPDLFPDVTGTADKRSLWFTKDQSKTMDDFFDYEKGYPTTKFRNKTRTGGLGNDPNRQFSDIDIPVFRLPEMFFIVAEAVKRGGSGATEQEGVDYINRIIRRAYGNNSADISTYDLDFILDEKAREFYWEAHRRIDLIRFNRYAESSYLWPWKGGIRNGTAFPAFRKILPIPSKQLSVNPLLTQNFGY